MLSYITCAVAYFLLLAAGLSFWRRRLAGSSLIPAIAAQCAWSVALAAQASGVSVPLVAVIASEYLRTLAWAVVLARCLAGLPDPRTARFALQTVSALIAVVIVALPALLAVGEPAGAAEYLSRYWIGGGLALSLGGLILIEQVARNTRAAHEWGVKYVWLAVGGIFAWDSCLYSTALLQGAIPPALWIARGFVNALLGALLIVGLRRISGWQSAAFLSPRLVFFSATLLGAAFYVLAMAVASYIIRDLGGSWGAAGQAVFLAGALLVLAVAVLSAQFRARFRVALAKYLFPYRYDHRRVWQTLTRALAETSEVPVYERIGQVMSASVNCASAGLWLKDSSSAFVPVGGDLASRQATPQRADTDFFDFLRRHDWIYDVEQSQGVGGDALPQPPAWMLAQSNIRLIVPLVCQDALIGFVALGQPLTDMHLTWEEIDLLRAAGHQVASYLAWEQAAKRLTESRQFETLNRLSAVIMHDLRHLIAQQALVVENAARHRRDPKFVDDAILTIDNSVKRMNRLMEELRTGARVVEEEHRVNLAELCAEVVKRCSHGRPAPTLSVGETDIEVLAHRDRMLHALEHVVRNAQDATSPSGSITVRLRSSGSRALIEVEDTGSGMDGDFIRNRLFRPFDSTKGERGMGIGAYQAREFARCCGGDVTVESAPQRGTRFTFSLPTAATSTTAATMTTTTRYELKAS